MSGSEGGLSQRLKEAIVGAIVKAGIEDADGVIKVLEELRKMKKKMRTPFYDSIHGMIARGVGKPKRSINWSMLDKVVAKGKVMKTTQEAKISRAENASHKKAARKIEGEIASAQEFYYGGQIQRQGKLYSSCTEIKELVLENESRKGKSEENASFS